MQQFYQFISTISIKLIILHVKVKQIRVISKSFREIKNFFSFYLVFTNM